MLNLNEFRKKINFSERILLITHQNPDGDALGSMLALNLALKSLNKCVSAICQDKVPALFSFLPNAHLIKQDFVLGDYDLIIILDCGDLKRTGFDRRIKQLSRKRKKIINIDHHPKNDIHRIAGLNLVDYEASSTAELIFNLIKHSNVKIGRDIATNLLCGIYTDTGGFQHSNTNQNVLKIASNLMRSGAKLREITANIANGRSISALKLWGLALSRVRKISNLGLVMSVITNQDLIDHNATADNLAGAVNLINTIPDSRAAILFYEIESGKIKASLRTERNDIDVSKLARLFGGGGLKKASGFTINGKIIQDGDGWKIINYSLIQQ